MKDEDKIRAINFVFIHWLIPSQKIKLKALKKVQRFCRRGSGNYAFSYMEKQHLNLKWWRSSLHFGPPVLFRQVANCLKCDKIPIRIFNKHRRAKWCFDKLCEHNDKMSDYILEKVVDNPSLFDFVHTDCFCNNKPPHVYYSMINNPRGNFTSKDGIRYIMCELSGDKLTYYTRFKLSQFITNRLR